MKPADILLQKGMADWLAPYAGYLLDVLAFNGIPYTITSVYRSIEKQASLYERYLRGENAYPVAPPGRSYHNYGRAMDLSIPTPGVYAALGGLWREMGGTWSPTDEIHFQA